MVAGWSGGVMSSRSIPVWDGKQDATGFADTLHDKIKRLLKYTSNL